VALIVHETGKGRPSLPRPVSTGIDPEFNKWSVTLERAMGWMATSMHQGFDFNWGLGPGDRGTGH
jgi:hypothetical protein